ncbi:NUMOD3 domain-containing DNA-binding protein [Sinorhizobium meliloti]|uniref:NUMOD3 domain-containing DNA-binding protein n=1 Tax=Rhizobium meliloti TaxID=382 RepID=UPI003D652D9D
MEIQTNANCGVYALRHLETGSVYVGGSSNVPTRKFSHLYKLARGKHENSTIQALYDASPSGNNAFECAMIECCNRDDLVKREQFWIDTLKPDLNRGKSNIGHKVFSEESKARMSMLRTGEGNAFYGRHHTAETKARLSALNRGKTLSEEHRRKIAEKSPTGEKHFTFVGYYRVPWGVFITSKEAAEAVDNQISPSGLVRICKSPDRVISRPGFVKCPYLMNLGESVIGKTFRQIGFSFIPKIEQN